MCKVYGCILIPGNTPPIAYILLIPGNTPPIAYILLIPGNTPPRAYILESPQTARHVSYIFEFTLYVTVSKFIECNKLLVKCTGVTILHKNK